MVAPESIATTSGKLVPPDELELLDEELLDEDELLEELELDEDELLDELELDEEELLDELELEDELDELEVPPPQALIRRATASGVPHRNIKEED